MSTAMSHMPWCGLQLQGAKGGLHKGVDEWPEGGVAYLSQHLRPEVKTVYKLPVVN